MLRLARLTMTLMGRSSAAALLLAIANGCCGFGACPPQSQFPDAQSALDQVRTQQQCSLGLSGEAKLDYYDDRGQVKAKTLFLVQDPASVRLDLISPFGATLVTFTSDGQNFALLDQKDKRFYVGKANQCNVERFLRVPVPPEVLVQLLGGEAPVLVHQPEQASIGWKRGRYRIQIDSLHQASQVIELEPHAEDWDKPYQQQRLRVVSVKVEQAGVVLYRADLGNYTVTQTAKPRVDPEGIEDDIPPSGPQCQAEVPHSVRFIVPVSERDVGFEHEQVEHNPPLLPGTFTQPIPGGVSVEASPCD